MLDDDGDHFTRRFAETAHARPWSPKPSRARNSDAAPLDSRPSQAGIGRFEPGTAHQDLP